MTHYSYDRRASGTRFELVVRARMHRTETVVRGEASEVRLIVTPSAKFQSKLNAMSPEKRLEWWPPSLEPSDFRVRPDGTVLSNDDDYDVEVEEGPWEQAEETTTLKSKYDGLE